ncbi:SDR family NAD(P)-dependent oxidoreductase [Pseudogemmobacter sonorensis]|uniref:SDR family NAD(P)-dependent oxidoreductase n=1 Tax=Pseudogemmobacter sonorensis TaxID=2989681 RepID=UPI00367E4330
MRDLEGRTALVSGSTTGLGYGVANALAARGARVVIHGLAPAREGEAMAAALSRDHGVESWHSGADLADQAATEALCDQVLGRFGRCDIVVNNAVIRHFKPVEEFLPEEWNRALSVNLSSAFHFARAFVPGMKAQGWGRIINMSSIYGQRGAESRIDYVTTKTALLGMTRALAIELARTGITCNAVAPGTVPTEAITARIAGLAQAAGQSEAEAEADYLVGRNPTRRFVEIGNVAALIGFLCSDAGQDITGATLPIDGGWSAL